MLIAVQSFHYKMEKERWMFFYIFFLIRLFVGLFFKHDRVVGSHNVKHKTLMIYCC